MAKTKKGKGNVGKIVAISAGVAALGGAAYYFFGPKSNKHQKSAKAWMVKMKKEVAKKVDSTKGATEKLYHSTVDSLAKTYSTQYKAHAPEIVAFAKQLKGQWKHIAKSAKNTVKKATKKAKPKATKKKK